MMRTMRILLLLFLQGAALAAGRPTQDRIAGADLDRIVKQYGRRDPPLCGSVLVARGPRILLDKGYGVADRRIDLAMPHDAMWDWASVTKQFTAAAVLKLAMQGRLDVDDPLGKHLGPVPARMHGITLRHLLTHTSGVDQSAEVDFGDMGRAAIIRAFFQYPVAFPPGKVFDYNNHGYFLLAAVIEKASGTSYENYVVRNLFEPAGMRDAWFIGMRALDLHRVPRENRGRGPRFTYGDELGWGYRGAGGAVVSLRDMYHWDRALRTTTVLDAVSLREMYRPARQGYAMGWEIHRDGDDVLYMHGGSVGTTVTFYLRARDSEVVVAAAFSHPFDELDELTRRLYERARAG